MSRAPTPSNQLRAGRYLGTERFTKTLGDFVVTRRDDVEHFTIEPVSVQLMDRAVYESFDNGRTWQLDYTGSDGLRCTRPILSSSSLAYLLADVAAWHTAMLDGRDEEADRIAAGTRIETPHTIHKTATLEQAADALEQLDHELSDVEPLQGPVQSHALKHRQVQTGDITLDFDSGANMLFKL